MLIRRRKTMAYVKPTINKIADAEPTGMEFVAADLSVSAIIVVAVIAILVIVVCWSNVSGYPGMDPHLG
jgi:hypothetical protein